MSKKMAALQGEAHFFEESMNAAKVKEYLSRPKVVDKLKGMKWLLAMVSKGRDVKEFFSDVVKNMAVRSVEVKKMVYIYLVHYADSDAQCRELALLSINSFQNDLRGTNQLIKALALRVMTSIRVPEIIQIQLLAVRDCASDTSPYVRKCAANAIPKIYTLDPDQAPQLCEVLEKLLKDGSTMVLGSAVAAFTEVCPEKFELLHPVYRKLCHLLADVDEWGQMSIISTLQRYLRTQFSNPQGGCGSSAVDSLPAGTDAVKVKKRRVVKRAFYSSEEDESTEEEVEVHEPPVQLPEIGSVFTTSDADIGGSLDPDHRLLLRCSLPLLKSRNSGVVLAVCALHYYCGSRSAGTLAQLAKAMVRILRNRREIQYVVLDAIRAMARESPSMFRPFLQDFFVKALDPLFNCMLKLDILTLLGTTESCSAILCELQTYVLHRDKAFVCAAVRAVGRMADVQPKVADHCLQGLLTLVTCSKTDVVVAEAVVVLRQLLQQNPNIEGMEGVLSQLGLLLLQSFMNQNVGNIDDMNQNMERDGAIAGTGVVAIGCTQPAARASIIWLLGEHPQQISAVAPDLLRLLAKAFPELEEEVKIQVLNYAVKVALHMSHVELIQSLAAYVLEMSRFDLSHDLRDRARFMTAILGLASADEGVDEAALLALNSKSSQVLLKPKISPVLETVGCSYQGMPHLALGSLSAMVGHRIDGYRPLPEWCSVQPDGNVRDPPQEDNKATAEGVGDDNSGSFYTGSSPEYSTGSGSESESDYSESESASESESGSMTGSESGTASESEYDSKSDDSQSLSSGGSRSRSSSDSQSSSASDASDPAGEEGMGLLNMGAGVRGGTSTYGASAPAPHSEDLTGLVQRLDVTDLDRSRSPLPTASSEALGVLSVSGVGTPATPAAFPAGLSLSIPNRVPTGTAVPAPGLVHNGGLVGAGGEALSFPSTLLRHQVGGGLQVDYRYARGLSNPSARPTTMLLIRLFLQNHRDVPIRRIRVVLPRDGTRMNGFSEVQSLGPRCSIVQSISVDFGGRGKEVRFELKTDKGSFMVSLKPPVGELLYPNFMTQGEFEEGRKSLGEGCAGRAEIQVSPSECSLLPTRVLQSANVVMVSGDTGGEESGEWGFSGCSLSGSMSERVFIVVSVKKSRGDGAILISSDKALLVPQLLEGLKTEIQNGAR